MQIIPTIEREIHNFLFKEVEVSENVYHSQYKTVRRIKIFENRTYPTGKVDSQGRYKYWYEIIKPRVDAEVKNLRVDSKHLMAFSDTPRRDFTAVFLANASMQEWMWESGKAEELNEVVERFSGHGNVIFKKTGDGYELCDPMNTYVTNQMARTVDETGIIERHTMTQSELRAKEGTWKNVDKVIQNCGNRFFSKTLMTTSEDSSSPLYEIFERNGEVSEKEMFEAQGKEGGDPEKYVLGRIIVAGLKKGQQDKKYVLFAESYPQGKKMSDFFKSAHRGPYKGKFWREGMYELLFDYQVRANEIGNQIARGLEYASKFIFHTPDELIAQNITTDLENGDIIKTQGGISQIAMRISGFDQLINDWNRIIQEADRIANSFEVVTGQQMHSGTPFRLGAMMDRNANKLFVFLRQKLTIQYKQVFNDWIIPQLLRDMKGKDIIRLTGDSDFLERFRKVQAESWFNRNLARIGPMAAVPTIKATVITAKVEQLQQEDPTIKNVDKKVWNDALKRVKVTISGENADFDEQMETIANLIQFETDPARRAWLLDRVYAIKGLPVPPTPQQQAPQVQPSVPGSPDQPNEQGDEGDNFAPASPSPEQGVMTDV